MHLWQAIKMACKSLWTNKLRSFLTMLGIIIGVMTVALLTSVASGVQTAVVSQIRTQSTLSIVMCTSKNMKYQSVYEVLKNNQHKPEDEDYYTFSLIYSDNTVVSSDLTGVADSENLEDFLVFNKVVVSEETYNNMTSSEKTIYDGMKVYLEKPAPSKTSVMAVNKNFAEVYDLNFEGNFPQNADELLVDRAFIETYLGKNITNQEALNRTVSLGVTAYVDLTFKFLVPVTDEIKMAVQMYMENIGYKDSIHSITASGNNLIVNMDYFTTSDEFVIKRLTEDIKNDQGEVLVSPPYKAALVSENPIEITEVYNRDNAQTYKIVGVLSEDNASMMSTMSTNSDSDEFSIFDLLMNSVKGSCYMLLDEANLTPLGVKEEGIEELADLPMTSAYMRFKTEDVMEDRVNDVTAAFMSQKALMYGSDFMIISMSAVASIVDSVMNTLTIMLTVISIVSLIIGGIGIMNIMLVAVTERTREIGIRKAIGAKKSSILVQFLVEALMLSLVGGAIGLGISAIGCAIIGHFMGITISMPLWVIGMSVGFCTAIGLIFGMFPAIKASNMQPIDALRRE